MKKILNRKSQDDIKSRTAISNPNKKLKKVLPKKEKC